MSWYQKTKEDPAIKKRYFWKHGSYLSNPYFRGSALPVVRNHVSLPEDQFPPPTLGVRGSTLFLFDPSVVARSAYSYRVDISVLLCTFFILPLNMTSRYQRLQAYFFSSVVLLCFLYLISCDNNLQLCSTNTLCCDALSMCSCTVM